MSEDLKVKPGEQLSAAKWNGVVDRVTAPARTPNGRTKDRSIAVPSCEDVIHVKITGAAVSGKWPWKEVERTSAGWRDSGRTGSASVDGVVEANGQTLTQTTKVYEARRSITSTEWVVFV